MFLQTQFLLINAHFTLYLLSALVFFSVAWLYFDAWLFRKTIYELARWSGFLLLSLSSLLYATFIDYDTFSISYFNQSLLSAISLALRALGFIILIIGQYLEPLQPLPDYRKPKTASLAVLPVLNTSVLFSLPLLSATAAFMYLRRATTGLEHHLKPISYSLFIIATSELFGLGTLFRNFDNITIAKLTQATGPLWITQRILLLLGILLLGRWVWGYLVRRLETQLLIILITSVLIIFLTTTIFFTTTSLNNQKSQSLDSLRTSAQVLSFTLESSKSQILSDAQLFAQNPQVISAIESGNLDTIQQLSFNFLLSKKQSSLIIVNSDSMILTQAENQNKTGQSLSSNPLIISALDGDTTATFSTKEGVSAPVLTVQAVTPVLDDQTIIGALLLSSEVNNSFVDGLKNATGLDASIYAGNTRSSTTFLAPDQKSRWIGISEDTPAILDTVLTNSQIYSGEVNILNVPYLASFVPVLDHTNNSIGMLFVGQPQINLLNNAKENIGLTFITTTILILLSVPPSFFLSRYIISQI